MEDKNCYNVDINKKRRRDGKKTSDGCGEECRGGRGGGKEEEEAERN